MWLTRALVLIGALNWGLIGLFRFDLVAAIFGGQTAFIPRVVYALIGFSAIVELFALGTRVTARNNK